MKPVMVIRHVPHKGLGLLSDVLNRYGLVYQYVEMYQNPPPAFRPEHLAGLIVMGGPMNVDQTDRWPMLLDEVRWLTQALNEGLPVLGICLGGQLLAKTLGAKVYPGPRKEIGWYEVEMTAEAAGDPLLGSFDLAVTVFQWHGDMFDLPREAVHLARGADVSHQAFRYGKSAYGLQFHLKVTEAMLANWLANPRMRAELSELDYVDPEEILRRAPEELPDMLAVGERVFSPFAGICHERVVGHG